MANMALSTTVPLLEETEVLESNESSGVVEVGDSDPGIVLVVSDDPGERDRLRGELEQTLESSVVVVGGAEEARRTVEVRPVDLLITKQNLAGVDILDLLRRLRNQGFVGSSLVMGAHLTDVAEMALRDLGALACLPRPVDIARLLGLCRCVLKHSEGELHGFSPTGIAQMLELEESSCLLRMQHGSCRGDLVFSRGRLIDASTSHETGESAAMAIFAWPSVDMHIFDLPPNEPATIHRKLNDLILESAQTYDEHLRDARNDAGLSSWFDEESENLVTFPRRVEDLPVISNEKIGAALDELLTIEGARRAALVNFEAGETVRSAAREAEGLTHDAEYTDFHLLRAFDVESVIEDVLITLADQYYLFRPLSACRQLLLHLVLDRSRANLALARHCLAKVESRLV